MGLGLALEDRVLGGGAVVEPVEEHVVLGVDEELVRVRVGVRVRVMARARVRVRVRVRVLVQQDRVVLAMAIGGGLEGEELGVGEQLHADPLAARLGCEAAVPELLIDRGQLPEAPGAVPLHVLRHAARLLGHGSDERSASRPEHAAQRPGGGAHLVGARVRVRLRVRGRGRGRSRGRVQG